MTVERVEDSEVMEAGVVSCGAVSVVRSFCLMPPQT